MKKIILICSCLFGAILLLLLALKYDDGSSREISNYQVQRINIDQTRVRNLNVLHNESDYCDSNILLKIDNNYSSPEKYLYLKEGRKLTILRSPFPRNVPEKLNPRMAHSYLVDVEMFKKYIGLCNKWGDTVQLLDKYSSFMAASFDTCVYRRIDNLSDYDLIMSCKKKRPTMIYGDMLISKGAIEKLLNEKALNQEYYYWFEDFGILRMQLKFNSNGLNTVESLFIGYLGNEIIAL